MPQLYAVKIFFLPKNVPSAALVTSTAVGIFKLQFCRLLNKISVLSALPFTARKH